MASSQGNTILVYDVCHDVIEDDAIAKVAKLADI